MPVEAVALKLANANPCYCLATLYGEQEGDEFDVALAHKNRNTWNRWFGDCTEGQREDIRKTFSLRMDGQLPPDPTEQIDFSNTHFTKRLHLAGFEFRRYANFRSSTFSDVVDFGAAQIGEADFRASSFEAGVNFQSAVFAERVGFESASFQQATSFNGVTFSSRADFSAARFRARAYFKQSRFFKIASFRSVQFEGDANFESAEFLGWAIFQKAAFVGATNFGATTFSKGAEFDDAEFLSTINFINAKFTIKTTFAGAHFKNSVPDFRGTTLHEATEWHGVVWPQPPLTKRSAQQQVYAYERLKQEMERLKKHEDEQSLFRKELRARRGLMRLFSGGWLLNLAYQWSSDYGNSFSRPVIWLCAVAAAGTAAFTRLPLCAGLPMPLKLAIRLSFANIFVFLPDKREIATTQEMSACLSNTTAAISAIQSLLGVILLFLLGLALRNRFRMK